MRRALFAVLLLLVARPAFADDPPARQQLVKEDWTLAPSDMRETCVTVPTGTLYLTASTTPSALNERARLDVYRPVGAYAAPLSVVTLSAEDATFLSHRVEMGEYCVRVNLSMHPERYVPGRQPPLWTGSRVSIDLSHEPSS